MKTVKIWIARNWRGILSRLPLPMLALAASYGVYRFASIFVPDWVAIVQAAAFEMTYIGLAVLDGLDKDERKRATAISIGAVIVSIAYNTIDGILTPIAVNVDAWVKYLLAFLHGAPLAVVAFLVADLLLHRKTPNKQAQAPTSPSVKQAQSAQATQRLAPLDNITFEVVRLRDEQGLSFQQIGDRLGFSRQAAQQRYTAAKQGD